MRIRWCVVLCLVAAEMMGGGGGGGGAPALPDVEMPRIFRADGAKVLQAAARVTTARYPDADTVRLAEYIHTRFEADGTDVTWVDAWVMALSEKGRRTLARASLGYNRRYGDARFEVVEIYGTNGICRKVDFAVTLKDATDNASTESNIVDPEDRRLSCVLPDFAVGEIRHLIYRRRQLKPLMAGAWSDIVTLEGTSPILKTQVTLDRPEDMPLAHACVRHETEGGVKRIPDLAAGSGRIISRWEAAETAQAFPEPNMPSLSSQMQGLYLSTVPDWKTVSRWYWKLCAPHLTANDAMTNHVRRLTTGITDRLARIRAIFRFVSQDVRYMGLTLEDTAPGYEPHDVTLTYTKRYGVCRDKAALLVSLLRVAGEEAFPVLIHAGAKMDAEVPTPFFNHAVTAIAWREGQEAKGERQAAKGEQSYLLMDPTDEHARDLFPSYLSNRSYLVARPEGEGLRTSPVIDVAKNMLHVEAEGSLSPEGTMLLTGDVTFGGVNDNVFRSVFRRRTPKERRDIFERWLRGSAGGAEVLDFTLEPQDMSDTERVLRARYTLRIREAVSRGQTCDTLTVPFFTRVCNPAEGILDENTALEHRRFPLELPTTAGAEERIRIRTNGALGPIHFLPKNATCTMPGFSYGVTAAYSNGIYEAARHFRVEGVDFEPEEYETLRETLKDVESSERGEPSFDVRETAETDVRIHERRTEIFLETPYRWVVTNTIAREALTYHGKKTISEVRLEYAPSVRQVEIVAAETIDPTGGVHRLAGYERNLLDADWVAAAPRYPASKVLTANLPAVETGCTVRVVTAHTVTNAVLAWTDFFTLDSLSPADLLEVKIHVPEGLSLKIRETGGITATVEQGDGMTHYTWRNKTPKRVPDEACTPAVSHWRKTIFATVANWDALAIPDASGMTLPLPPSVEEAATPEEKIVAIRKFMTEHVQTVGPGLFELPFQQAVTSPDRVLAEGYASALDRMILFKALLESAGFRCRLLLTAGDARGDRSLAKIYREYPRPSYFGELVIRAEYVGWERLFGFSGEVFYLANENEYAPVHAFSRSGDTYYDLETGAFGVIPEGPMPSAEKTAVTMNVRRDGAVDFDFMRELYGSAVGSFRKRYAEMRPEMRERHFQQLVGKLAQNARATRELVTDITSYPARLSFSAYVPEYAMSEGGVITVKVPGLDDPIFALPHEAGMRKAPISQRGATEETESFDVTFPAGFMTIESLPEEWECRDPGTGILRASFHVTVTETGGALTVHLERRRFKTEARIFAPEYAAWMQEWNRRATSPSGHTIRMRTR